jgi:putative DNA primase/helicase
MDEQSINSMQRVLNLIRVSSSNDVGVMVKGTASGGVQTFETRCMFYLSSIGDTIALGQDKQRITVLNVRAASEITDPTELNTRYVEFMNAARALDRIPHLSARLLKRLIAKFDMHQKNVETFTKVCSAFFKSMRYGDQIGTLLAGRWILTMDTLVSEETAWDILKRNNWSEIISESIEIQEDADIINQIMAADVMCELIDGKVAKRKVAELLVCASDELHENKEHIRVSQNVALQTLSRSGIRVAEGRIMFAVSGIGYINELLKNSPYFGSWHKILKRHPNAEYGSKQIDFGNVRHRYIAIPLDKVFRPQKEDALELT